MAVVTGTESQMQLQSVIRASLKRKFAGAELSSATSNGQMAIKKSSFLFSSSSRAAATTNKEISSTKPLATKSNLINNQLATATSLFKNKIEFFNSTSSSSNSSSMAKKHNLKQSHMTAAATSSIGGLTPLTLCYICNEKVFLMERVTVLDCIMHATCFRCNYCNRLLRNGNGCYFYSKDPLQPNSKCKSLFKLDCVELEYKYFHEPFRV